MTALGYEYLRQTLGLTAFAPARPALLKPVTRIEPVDGYLAIPRHAAPDSDDPVAHLLFALKHEGTNLQILSQALPQIDPAALLDALRQSPTGAYIRTACFHAASAVGDPHTTDGRAGAGARPRCADQTSTPRRRRWPRRLMPTSSRRSPARPRAPAICSGNAAS